MKERVSKKRCPKCSNMVKVDPGSGKMALHTRYFGGFSVQCPASGKVWSKS